MTKRHLLLPAGIIILVHIILLSGSCGRTETGQNLTDGEFWKEQGLKKIIPFWQQHIVDTASGGFFLNLSEEGDPLPPFNKHPAMISRQIYGFCCAYLQSGNETYLSTARKGVKYLMENAWDPVYGGWYDLLDENGKPSSSKKTVPDQLYTNVGLAQYYFVTGDKEVLEKVMESVRIRQTHAKDKVCGGYFQSLNRDLTVADSTKSKHSHYGYTSSLLINLILFTNDRNIQEFAAELMDISIADMTDSLTGWFGGFPVPQTMRWEHALKIMNGKEVISAGAQLTACLSLMRLSEINGNKEYRALGMKIAEQLLHSSYNDSRGVWFDKIYKDPPSSPADTTVSWWWLQSYGMFSVIHLYHLTGDDKYLGYFEKMASAWNTYFIDPEHGGAYIGIDPDGKPVNTRKASAWKSSYHEMETSLLNYLYLNLYVSKNPATLYFNITKADKGDKHFVTLAEDPSIRIKSVKINGKIWDAFNPEDRSVTLPAGKNIKMTVTLEPEK